MNIFSTPLYTSIKEIDEIIELNSRLTKSQVKTFYWALPYNAVDRTSLEQARSFDPKINSFADAEKYIEYSLEKGFNFIYLLNSIQGMAHEDDEFKKQQDAVDKLLNNLRKLNTFKLRITDFRLLSYIKKNYPDFEIYLSTSTEYTKIAQFQNLLKIFPDLKEVIPSYEMNRDFHFLKNLKKVMGNINIELIVNEGCMTGCPFRIQHPLFFTRRIGCSDLRLCQKSFSEVAKYSYMCFRITNRAYNEYLCKTNVIFPWDIKYYNDIGYRYFKFVGRDDKRKHSKYRLASMEFYLIGIEDDKLIKDIPINALIHRYKHLIDVSGYSYTVGEVKDYLPSMEYFIKNGKDCHYKCGFECKYCYDKAKKLDEVFADRKLNLE